MTPPIDLSHLFSPSSGAPPHPISCARMSILGPLPPSTVFHLALNFIQKQKRSISSSPASKDSSVAHADADADSLGSRPDVLLLCTSRSALFAGLLEENNGYLAEHGGDPALASLLQEHMEVRCLETTATWLFWCAAVQCGAPGAQHPPPPSPGERALDLKRTPDLVIVSGLSGLLGEDGNKGAGVEGYASLLAAVTAAFPSPTRMVFLDHPTEEHLAPPLLPSDLNKGVAQRQGQLFRKGQGDASTSAAAPTASKTQVSSTIEPRRMPLESVLEYFCDTVGVVSAHGGTEDGHVSWFEIRTGASPRGGTAAQGQRQGEGEIDVRYAVRLAAEDGNGWSGRERFEVAFG